MNLVQMSRSLRLFSAESAAARLFRNVQFQARRAELQGSTAKQITDVRDAARPQVLDAITELWCQDWRPSDQDVAAYLGWPINCITPRCGELLEPARADRGGDKRGPSGRRVAWWKPALAAVTQATRWSSSSGPSYLDRYQIRKATRGGTTYEMDTANIGGAKSAEAPADPLAPPPFLDRREPAFPPEHANIVGRISCAVCELAAAATITPAEALAAIVGNRGSFWHDAERAVEWLSELLQEKEHATERHQRS